MKADSFCALCGLFLAGWAYEVNNARVLGWALALIAALLLLRPLLDLRRRVLDHLGRFSRPSASVPVPLPTLSPMDIAINAAVDRFVDAKRARLERHIRR